MSKQYSLEAHVLHSGLQLVWKRLNVTKEMDGWHLLVNNRDIFSQVSAGVLARFGIVCREDHMKEAANMLHYAFQLNIPKSFYVIVRRMPNLDQYSVTLDDAGEIVRSDAETEWTQEEAHEMLMAMKERYPKEMIHLETRIPRYVRRTMYGDF